MLEQESILTSLSKIPSPSTDVQCVSIHVIVFVLSEERLDFSNTAKT